MRFPTMLVVATCPSLSVFNKSVLALIAVMLVLTEEASLLDTVVSKFASLVLLVSSSWRMSVALGPLALVSVRAAWLQMSLGVTEAGALVNVVTVPPVIVRLAAPHTAAATALTSRTAVPVVASTGTPNATEPAAGTAQLPVNAPLA